MMIQHQNSPQSTESIKVTELTPSSTHKQYENEKIQLKLKLNYYVSEIFSHI